MSRFGGNRTDHLADIQQAISDWETLKELSERYEDVGDEDSEPIESSLDTLRLEIASRIFDYGVAEHIYEALRASRKYSVTCDCKTPSVRTEYSCIECYGAIDRHSLDASNNPLI